MGAQNLSCQGCGGEVQAEDLASGKAALHAQQHWCPGCLEALLERAQPEERKQILVSIRRTVKASEHGELKAPPQPAIRINSPRPPTVRVDTVVDSLQQIRPRPRARRRFAAAIAIGAVLTIVVAGGAYSILRGGEATTRAPAPRMSDTVPAAPFDKPSDLETGSPLPPAKEKDSVMARFEAARMYQLAYPEDLDRIVRLYSDAARAAAGTALGEEIEREASVLRARLAHRIREEMGRFRSAAEPLLEERRYGLCRRLCETARGLFVQDEWAGFIARFIEEIEARAGREFEALEIEARALARAGKRTEAAEVLRRAEAFELDSVAERARRLRGELADFTAQVPVAKPPTPPTPPRPPAPPVPPTPPTPSPPSEGNPEPGKPPARDPEQQRRLLEQAWAHAVKMARGREYDRAVQTIEFAARSIEDGEIKAEATRDAETLRTAGAVVKGALEELMRLKKDAQVTLRYLDDDDKLRTARGRVVSVSSDGVSLSSGDEILLVPFTRLAASEIMDYYARRSDAGPQDARAVGLFSLFEGDVRRAKKELGNELAGLPEKYRMLARDDGGVGPGSEPAAGKSKEEVARELFEQAEKDFSTNRLKQALAGYQELRKRHRSSETWRENRKLIEERLRIGLESVVLPGSMKATTYWTRQSFPGAPLPDAYVFPYSFAAGANRAYYLDIEFFAQEEAVYRIWVLVGGDGKENTAFQVQYSGAVAKDGRPAHVGQSSFVDVPPLPGVANTASKGMTTTWGWASVAMHKFKETGTQQLRIYASTRGMAIAAVVISAEKYRANPPTPKDLGQ